MASHCHQYIFGEFSPDEFTQFFLTPQHYVELPPVSDKVSCAGQSSGELCAPAPPLLTDTVTRQVCGARRAGGLAAGSLGPDWCCSCTGSGCGHVRFGVDELMEPEPTGTAEAARKLSSNLNPQAPEFILGCQTPQEATLGLPMADGADFESGDGPEPGLPTLDESSALSGLVQPERRRKKKRPPGYYSYMEGQGCSTTTHAKASLVNGHTPVSHTVEPEDELREGSPGAELSSCGQGSPETVASAGANSWICESPRELTPDLAAVVVPVPDHSAMLSPSFSLSHELAGGGRTADQPAVESPELQDSGGQSPRVPSPPPPPKALTVAPASAVPDGAECRVSRPSDAQPGHVFCAPVDSQKHDSESTDGETQPGAQHTWPCGSAVSPAPPAGFSIVNPPKSWASLFHNSKPLAGSPQAYVQVKSEPAGPASAVTPEYSVEVDESPLHMSEDPLARRLAELIENVKLIHKPVSLQPRGLINKGNWCYINATLQALVACPPMYHLMKSLPAASEARRPCSSTPMINNFVRLVNEFSNMPVPSKAKQQAAGDKVMKDIRPGIPFEPSYIYRLLTVIKSSPSEKGRQEDAEEYLGYILNGLHEEMLALKKLLSPQEEKVSTLNGPESPSGGEVDSAGREEEGSDDEWEQVGPRNRTSVMRQTDYVRTPITDIFGGHIRSVVYQQSSRESATLQPFFTLQLDIQSEKVRTVQEALENLVARECVQGYTSKAKQEVEVSRRVTLEELPPVLLLHLKRFVFEKNGGCQKLVKNVDYPIDLEISKDLLSPGVRSKIFKGQRTYRLFAVVYHHGNSATGGHYTTDVFHIGLSGWLRIDDQAVKVISQYQVLKQTAERTAYLLYYRRLDLL